MLVLSKGGQLTEAGSSDGRIRVVLFDEIEKAHPEVWNTLLQILDDGRMTDGQGRTVDFRNTVIIMTSNLGTDFAKRGGALGFIRDGSEEAIADHQRIEKAVRDTFRPEFLNRVDEIIIFSPLSQDQVEKIVEIQMRSVHKRLLEGRSRNSPEPRCPAMAGTQRLRPAIRGTSITPDDSALRRKSTFD